MKIDFTDRVLDALEDAPPAVRKAFRKQLHFLAGNLHHPSLHAKKYDEARDLWQARVTKAGVSTSRSWTTPTDWKTSRSTPRSEPSTKLRKFGVCRSPYGRGSVTPSEPRALASGLENR